MSEEAKCTAPGSTAALLLRCVLAVALLRAATGQLQTAYVPLSLLQLPPGFNISLYAPETMPNARQMTLSRGFNPEYPDAVIVYVGSTGAGEVRLLHGAVNLGCRVYSLG